MSASLTSAADTNESVEAMLMLSLRQASSRSSLPKMSAILSVMENNHYNVMHNTVLYVLHVFISCVYHGNVIILYQ